MSVTKIITLTNKGNNAGPYYEVSCSNDCVTYGPCLTTGSIYLPTIGSVTNVSVYDTTTCIKLVNHNAECNNSVIHNFAASGSTTTTSTTSTTSTSTTTTTTAPTTTTTTFSSNPCACMEVVVTSDGASWAIFDCYGNNQNVVAMTAGTYYTCVAVVGGLPQLEFIYGTGTKTQVGNCKTGTCPPAANVLQQYTFAGSTGDVFRYNNKNNVSTQIDMNILWSNIIVCAYSNTIEIVSGSGTYSVKQAFCPDCSYMHLTAGAANSAYATWENFNGTPQQFYIGTGATLDTYISITSGSYKETNDPANKLNQTFSTPCPSTTTTTTTTTIAPTTTEGPTTTTTTTTQSPSIRVDSSYTTLCGGGGSSVSTITYTGGTNICNSTSIAALTFNTLSAGNYFMYESSLGYVQYNKPGGVGTNTMNRTGGGCTSCTTTTTTTTAPTTTTTTTAPIYYYNVTRYRCFPCGVDATNLIASSPVSLVNHIYYNNGDGYVYYINYGTGAAFVDVDLASSASDAICSLACSI